MEMIQKRKKIGFLTMSQSLAETWKVPSWRKAARTQGTNKKFVPWVQIFINLLQMRNAVGGNLFNLKWTCSILEGKQICNPTPRGFSEHSTVHGTWCWHTRNGGAHMFLRGVPGQPGQQESWLQKTQTKECRAGGLGRTLWGLKPPRLSFARKAVGEGK